MNSLNGNDYLWEATLTSPDIDGGTADNTTIGKSTPAEGWLSPAVAKGPAIITSFAGTVTAAASTTVTFSSASDAILAGYRATNPVLGATLISNALTRYITAWIDSTTCTVDSSVTWAGTAITSVHLPITTFVDSAGVVKGWMNAAGNVYFVSNVGIGTTSPGQILDVQKSTDAVIRVLANGTDGSAYNFISRQSSAGDGFLAFQTNAVIDQIIGLTSTLGASKLQVGGTEASPSMVISSGNVGIGTTFFGTSAVKVLAIGSGTAPTTSPADAVQMWSQNNTGQGASGLAQLYILDEYGISGPVMHALDQRDCENIIEDLSYYPPVTFTWNPGSLADGVGETSAAISVPGVSLGGAAVQCIAPYDLQGVTLNAYVNAADSCQARLQNETTGTIDLASGTWTMQARRI